MAASLKDRGEFSSQALTSSFFAVIVKEQLTRRGKRERKEEQEYALSGHYRRL
jgi:hypothetical protein